jgi:hypothetical protein
MEGVDGDFASGELMEKTKQSSQNTMLIESDCGSPQAINADIAHEPSVVVRFQLSGARERFTPTGAVSQWNWKRRKALIELSDFFFRQVEWRTVAEVTYIEKSATIPLTTLQGRRKRFSSEIVQELRQTKTKSEQTHDNHKR